MRRRRSRVATEDFPTRRRSTDELMRLHPTALAELRSPPSLSPAALTDLSCAGFCVVPGWLSAAAAQAVLTDAMSCEAAGLPRRAGVGSTRSGATAVRNDEVTRRSSMLPLYPPPRQSAGLVDVRLALMEAVRSLGAELEAQAQWLPALAPFRTELAYLYYPAGGLYLRHMDVPSARGGFNPLGRSEADGGSFSGAATRREVSMLLYLEPSWVPARGGELRIFERGEGDVETHVDVAPEAGTLACALCGTSEAAPTRSAASGAFTPMPPAHQGRPIQQACPAPRCRPKKQLQPASVVRVARGRRPRTHDGPWVERESCPPKR